MRRDPASTGRRLGVNVCQRAFLAVRRTKPVTTALPNQQHLHLMHSRSGRYIFSCREARCSLKRPSTRYAVRGGPVPEPMMSWPRRAFGLRSEFPMCAAGAA